MPQKPRLSKKYPNGTVVVYTRLPVEVHRVASQLAKAEASTLGQWIKAVVSERTARSGGR